MRFWRLVALSIAISALGGTPSGADETWVKVYDNDDAVMGYQKESLAVLNRIVSAKIRSVPGRNGKAAYRATLTVDPSFKTVVSQTDMLFDCRKKNRVRVMSVLNVSESSDWKTSKPGVHGAWQILPLKNPVVVFWKLFCTPEGLQ